MTPHSPLTPCTLMAPTGSSILMLVEEEDADQMTSTPAIAPMMNALTGVTNAQGDGDGDQAREHAVAHHRRVGLAVDHPHVEDAAQGRRHAGDHRVDRDDADAAVGAGQRAAGVEAEPAEGEDERAELHHRDVVRQDRVDLAVLACTCRCAAR